jgi:endonuclease YncB( thermonuclease family)
VCHARIGLQDIQEALIAEGYAWYAFQFAHELDADQAVRYREAEQRARSQRLGLWQEPEPMPPWVCRKYKRAGKGDLCR